MIERPLMTPDELKSMPKGQFIVMKTGFYPMKVQLKLFFKWGIEFLDPYIMPERAGRIVCYASKDELMHEISMRHLHLPVEAANAPEGMSDNAIPFSESTSEKTTKLKTGETAGTEDTNEQP